MAHYYHEWAKSKSKETNRDESEESKKLQLILYQKLQ